MIKVQNDSKESIKASVNEWRTAHTEKYTIEPGHSNNWDRTDRRGFVLAIEASNAQGSGRSYFVNANDSIVVIDGPAKDELIVKAYTNGDGGILKVLNVAGTGGSVSTDVPNQANSNEHPQIDEESDMPTGYSLLSAGWQGYGQLGNGIQSDEPQSNLAVVRSNIKPILPDSGRLFHSIVGADGVVWSWGANDFQATATGHVENPALFPAPSIFEGQVPFEGKRPDIRFVSTGPFHQVALDSDGNPWVAGCNNDQRLGRSDGHQTQFVRPTLVPQRFSYVCAGGSANWDGRFTIGIDRENGGLWGWGWANTGVLGPEHGRDSGVPINLAPSLDVKWKMVSANFWRALAVSEDGRLYSWGYQWWKSLGPAEQGHGQDRDIIDVPTLVTVADPAGGANVQWVKVALGHDHVLGLDSKGRVWGWGKNMNFCLAQAELDGLFDPQLIPLPDGKRIVDIAAAGLDDALGYSAAVADDGDVFVWGSNRNSQLGLPASENVTHPTQAPLPAGLKACRVAFGDRAIFVLAQAK
ncbi:hypothetical protein GCM10027093_60590 [Paraburkholderia jirisanensis]